MFTTTIWFLKKIGRKRNSFWGNGERGDELVYLSGEESQQPNRTFALPALNAAIINVLWFE